MIKNCGELKSFVSQKIIDLTQFDENLLQIKSQLFFREQYFETKIGNDFT